MLPVPCSNRRFQPPLPIPTAAATDLTSLGAFRHIQTINLAGNRIRDAAPLGALPYLLTVDLSDNVIDSLAPMAACRFLGALLAGSGIEEGGGEVWELPSEFWFLVDGCFCGGER